MMRFMPLEIKKEWERGIGRRKREMERMGWEERVNGWHGVEGSRAKTARKRETRVGENERGCECEGGGRWGAKGVNC